MFNSGNGWKCRKSTRGVGGKTITSSRKLPLPLRLAKQREKGVVAQGLGLPTRSWRHGGEGVIARDATHNGGGCWNKYRLLSFFRSPSSSSTCHWVNQVRSQLSGESGVCHLFSKIVNRTETGKEQT